MIKKFVALAVTALFSLNASAGYVQYNFSDGNDLSGYFVQNQDDLSIAYYDFFTERYPAYTHFQPGYRSNIDWVKARYNNTGPSRFAVYNAGSEVYDAEIWFNFSATNTPGTYSYTSYFNASQSWDYPTDWWAEQLKPTVHYYNGTVTQTAVDPNFAELLDLYLNADNSYPDGLAHIAPKANVIPEPTSLALLVLGAAGLVSASRRRKSAK